ncbi:MAG: DoxX family membrane protein [Pyrinomonadaceae bacterium]
MRRVKLTLKYLFGALFVLAGLYHFINPDYYVKIMPPYLPWHLFLVYLSGFFEVVLGIMLLVKKLVRVAAWGMIALLVAVFPANIHMAANPELYPEINPLALWVRLPLQAVLAAWAFWYTRSRPDEREESTL